MSKAVQFKKKAADCEQKKQYDRALTLYLQAIEATEPPEEPDIQLYNRVGDLYLRLGDRDQAVTFYERAVDLYTDGGFFSNAIALCNKVLRYAPTRSLIYYKLGKISAQKGFNTDAKQNFLEYAGRMQKSGQLDEAFRALREFADLCPGQDDVRLMLAEQLGRVGRTAEALEQLEILYDTMLGENRQSEANATLDRMRTLDPAFTPRQGNTRRQTRREGLVFLDLDGEFQHPEPIVEQTEIVSEETLGAKSVQGFEETPLTLNKALLQAESPVTASSTLDKAADLGLEKQRQGRDSELANSAIDLVPLPGLELTAVDTSIADIAHGSLLEPEDITQRTENFPLAGIVPPIPFDNEFTAHSFLLAGVVPQEDPIEALAKAAERPVAPIPSQPSDLTVPLVQTDTVSAPPNDTSSNTFSAISNGTSSITTGTTSHAKFGITSDATSNIASDATFRATTSTTSTTSNASSNDFIDLTEWLRETQPAPNPRMTAQGEADEDNASAQQTDFTSMLETFKRGIAENVDESDSESHYDLGVAYMEMGLLTEAITQFQKVLRGNSLADRRVRAYESLGRCFVEQGDYDIARASLSAALSEPGLPADTLVGVFYLLGYSCELTGRWAEAQGYYKRVVAIDITFRDVTERLRRAANTAVA